MKRLRWELTVWLAWRLHAVGNLCWRASDWLKTYARRWWVPGWSA